MARNSKEAVADWFHAGAFVALCLCSGGDASSLRAQSLPPIHALGPVLARSVEPLDAVSQVRALPGGRVIANDNKGHRILLFDSTFQQVRAIADATPSTGNAYGSRPGGLIAYHGDSTLFVDPKSVAMIVLDPAGRPTKALAPPPTSLSGVYLIGGAYGTPGLDANGRLVFYEPISKPPDRTSDLHVTADSAMIVRFNFVTRSSELAAKWRVPPTRFLVYEQVINGRQMGTVEVFNDPIPWTDDWAVLADGTIAVVRGQDYRVEFVAADGKVTSGPKVPFVWQRLTDEAKAGIIDSARSAMDAARQVTRDSIRKANPNTPFAANTPLPFRFVELGQMPDYRPPFQPGAAHGDADGHLWVRTSVMSNGGAVYDVINREGVLIDRIAVPQGRVIAGFGPKGMVYMGVLDGNIARLERARVVIAGK